MSKVPSSRGREPFPAVRRGLFWVAMTACCLLCSGCRIILDEFWVG